MEKGRCIKECNYTSCDPVKNEDRILRRGDLARIIGLQRGKLKDHTGDLGRIVQSKTIEEISAVGISCDDKDKKGKTNDGHSFLYTVELVLGGKLHGVPRSELKYTTASEEGMTGESRQRRKRKPTISQEDTNRNTDISSKKKKITSCNKTKNRNSTKATTTKNSTGNKSNNKKGLKNTVGNTNNAKKNSKKQEGIQSATTSEITRSNSMLERHRREFERCILRLQKIDAYNFFSDDYIPPEFDECYDYNLDDNDKEKSPLRGETAMLNYGIQQTQNESISSMTSKSLSLNRLSTKLSLFPENFNDNAHEGSVEDVSSLSSSKEYWNDNRTTNSVIFPNQPPYNFVVLRKRLERGRYILDRERFEREEYFDSDYRKTTATNTTLNKMITFLVQNPIGIDWELFCQDVIGMCNAAVERNSDDGSPGTLSNIAGKIKVAVEQVCEKTGRRQAQEMELSNDAHRFTKAIDATENTDAAMQGKKWKKDAFPERVYERLKTDTVCAGLSELDERVASYELQTNLRDSFVGLSYTYNDTGQSEEWMKKMLNNADEKNEQEKAAMALSSDDGVIKAQVEASIQSLIIAVQDRVMTNNRVLEQKELRSANWECGIEKVGDQVISTKLIGSDTSNPEIVEQPVWGIDCYTRKNISICLETKFDHDTILVFIEKWLLPVINACPVDMAYNLSNAARILEGLPFDTASSLNQQTATTTEQWSTKVLGRALIIKIKETGPSWLYPAARLLRKAVDSMGLDFFRVHPKGHGSIVLSPKIEPNRLLTFYRGEIYPSWRWGEKMDAISLIQQRKNLKPRLPDFYNMALERPQIDPRGYGLLFVDASRKSGYGSMLSHSCNPSCEVRVAAVNGKLTLAMTTLRELTIGDEVTFDYNAVTESLHEFQDAVCMCGQGKCRGSFLHFATADCYQQVLNRNSPVAVRLSQVIKGCTKKVMSEDDEKILKRHGFRTAAFGAVSVKRKKETYFEFDNTTLDSMDFVPIWLRTHVADILRYIEYERRALPIALISNQITQNTDVIGSERNEKIGVQEESDSSSLSNDTVKSVDDKPVKQRSKPQPTFFSFLTHRRDHFVSLLMQDNEKSTLKGNEWEREIRKLASVEWKSFDDEIKQKWKEWAISEWEKSGGTEKSHFEQLRLEKLSQPKNADQLKKSVEQKQEQEQEKPLKDNNQCHIKKISFQAADAEGMAAMEQRIQQLTQTLSRVGRVLDRHREKTLRKNELAALSDHVHSSAVLRELAHSPLSIMPDDHVVAWMWNHEDGTIRTLLRMADKEICVSPDLKLALKQTESKYSALKSFGTPWDGEDAHFELPMSPAEGRQLLDKALLEFRTTLVNGMHAMAAEIKSRKVSARESAKRRKEQAKKVDKVSTLSSVCEIRGAIKIVLNDVLDSVEQSANSHRIEDSDNDEISEPWLQNYNKRFKLEKAADVLLMYLRTSTFFRLVPYESLQSTPIEVYAREIGNSVPRSVMDEKKNLNAIGESAERISEHHDSIDSDKKVKLLKKTKATGLCKPEDIISEVVVDYQGDYVLSQILQWYNAGIGQQPGLPDILGCAVLPSMSGCWTIDSTKVSNSATDKKTGYQSLIRPKLIEWLKDPYKRGNPWSDEVRKGFVDRDDKLFETPSTLSGPIIGSPILDFLVTGDDFNIMDLLRQLGTNSTTSENDVLDGLLSSIDHGRPAQAVSNWIQCENPDCQKWRKIPWHVDIDMLSEKFVCSDNLWRPNFASCDAPEDDWDETIDACVYVDGSIKPHEIDRYSPETTEIKTSYGSDKSSVNLTKFDIGSRFDVLRPGKETWCVANIVDVDLELNKIKFHLVRTHSKSDIWLEEKSERIAPLYTHTIKSKSKQQVKSQLSSVVCTKILEEKQTKSSELKKRKTKKLKKKKQRKSISYISLPSESNKECDALTAVSVENEIEVKGNVEEAFEEIGVGAENESYCGDENVVKGEVDFKGVEYSEGENDELERQDDNYSGNDIIVAESEIELKRVGTINGTEYEESKKPIAVTDHSSADGSPNSESDFENYSAKDTDHTNSSFTIPKKKELSISNSAPLVIPKKIQAPLLTRTSLISNTARQVFEVKKKKMSPKNRYSKKLLGIHIQRETPNASTDTSLIRDSNYDQKNNICSVNQGSPSLNRSYRISSTSNNSHHQPTVLSKVVYTRPKHSTQDQYSIEHKCKRELYCDSKSTNQNNGCHPKNSYEYTDQRKDSSYDLDDIHNPTSYGLKGQNNATRKSPSLERNRGKYQFDHNHSSCDVRERNPDIYDRGNRNDISRFCHYDKSYDKGTNNKRSRDYDEHYERCFSNKRITADCHTDDAYCYDEKYNDYDNRRHEGGYKRPSKELEDIDICRSDHNYRFDNEYEERSSSRFYDNKSYREGDIYDRRRPCDSSRRGKEKYRQEYDGSDEYTRRLDGFNQSQSYDGSDEYSRRLDGCNRKQSNEYCRRY